MFLTALFLCPLLFSTFCVADPAQEAAQALVDNFLKASVTNDTKMFISLIDPSFSATVCGQTINAGDVEKVAANLVAVQGSRTAINAVLTGDVLKFDVIPEKPTGPDHKISCEAKKGADGFKVTTFAIHGAQCPSPNTRKSVHHKEADVAETDNYF